MEGKEWFEKSKYVYSLVLKKVFDEFYKTCKKYVTIVEYPSLRIY